MRNQNPGLFEAVAKEAAEKEAAEKEAAEQPTIHAGFTGDTRYDEPEADSYGHMRFG